MYASEVCFIKMNNETEINKENSLFYELIKPNM